MKISATPTDHLLVRACTCSDRDDCDFAVICCDPVWRERMASRLEDAAAFHTDEDFLCFHYTVSVRYCACCYSKILDLFLSTYTDQIGHNVS